MTYKEIYEAVTVSSKDDFTVNWNDNIISFKNNNPLNNLPHTINMIENVIYFNYMKNGKIHNENGLAVVRLNKKTFEIEYSKFSHYCLNGTWLTREEWETEVNRIEILNNL